MPDRRPAWALSSHAIGRPKGSRNRFSQKFVDEFYEHWLMHGAAAIDEVCPTLPAVYVSVADSERERLDAISYD